MEDFLLCVVNQSPLNNPKTRTQHGAADQTSTKQVTTNQHSTAVWPVFHLAQLTNQHSEVLGDDGLLVRFSLKDYNKELL